jgi:hypothetical protein
MAALRVLLLIASFQFAWNARKHPRTRDNIHDYTDVDTAALIEHHANKQVESMTTAYATKDLVQLHKEHDRPKRKTKTDGSKEGRRKHGDRRQGGRKQDTRRTQDQKEVRQAKNGKGKMDFGFSMGPGGVHVGFDSRYNGRTGLQQGGMPGNMYDRNYGNPGQQGGRGMYNGQYRGQGGFGDDRYDGDGGRPGGLGDDGYDGDGGRQVGIGNQGYNGNAGYVRAPGYGGVGGFGQNSGFGQNPGFDQGVRRRRNR